MGYRVTLELNERQAGVVMAACEEYLRLRLGQCWDLVDELALAGFVYDQNDPDNNTKFNAYIERRDRMRSEMERAIREPWPGGIVRARVPDGDIAGDVWMAIRHAVAYHKHPEGGTTVEFGHPLQMGSEPLPSVRVETV